jgi:hypothetical protein
MPHKKVKMMEMYMKETIKRVQQDQPVILSHSEIRRCYTKGSVSIYRQMLVPLGMSGGKALSHFAVVHVENAELPPMTLMSSLTTRHGPSALPITRYSKPPQVQPFLDKTCSLAFCSWLTGINL